MNFYLNIKCLCYLNNIKLKDLSKQLGLTRDGLQATCVNGSISLAKLEKISEMFDIPLSELVSDIRG